MYIYITHSLSFSLPSISLSPTQFSFLLSCQDFLPSVLYLTIQVTIHRTSSIYVIAMSMLCPTINQLFVDCDHDVWIMIRVLQDDRWCVPRTYIFIDKTPRKVDHHGFSLKSYILVVYVSSFLSLSLSLSFMFIIDYFLKIIIANFF